MCLIKRLSSDALKTGQLCYVFNEITQFYLPPTRFIPARAEQYLEHYVRNELLKRCYSLYHLERVEA